MLSSKNPDATEGLGSPVEDASTKKVRFQLDPDHELRTKNKASKIYKPTTKHGVSPHPIGIKPLGNFYLRDASSTHDSAWRRKSLGYFDRLTDETILKILEYCEPQEIIKLSYVSKGFYAFSYFDDPWKELVIEEFNGDFDFKGSWRLTYIQRAFSDAITFALNPFPVQIAGFYSDVLFQPWLCASTGIGPFLGKENIDRRSNLSLEEFIEEYEVPNKPVIITDVIEKWPAFKSWTEDKLTHLYGDVKFRAEAIDISLKRYFDYSHQNLDESPVYLFDKKFGDNCPGMLADFEVPIYFRDDLFQLLGNDRRPDYRWLIIGPARSGSTFHKDPNATSAWNAVLTGSKKWIMFPPNCPPPGVYTNKDESEVTSPVSIMDWHLNYYQEAINETEIKPVEAICRAGEIMFVPSGWWHLVVNLEGSIALTQNYVSHQNAEAVLNFMYHKPDQVSGWRYDPSCILEKDEAPLENSTRQTLFDAFSEKYEAINPELVAKIKSTQSKANPAPSFWEKLTTQDEGGFQFGFGASDEEYDG